MRCTFVTSSGSESNIPSWSKRHVISRRLRFTNQLEFSPPIPLRGGKDMLNEADERARLWRGMVFGVGLSIPIWAGLIWGCAALLRTMG